MSDEGNGTKLKRSHRPLCWYDYRPNCSFNKSEQDMHKFQLIQRRHRTHFEHAGLVWRESERFLDRYIKYNLLASLLMTSSGLYHRYYASAPIGRRHSRLSGGVCPSVPCLNITRERKCLGRPNLAERNTP